MSHKVCTCYSNCLTVVDITFHFSEKNPLRYTLLHTYVRVYIKRNILCMYMYVHMHIIGMHTAHKHTYTHTHTHKRSCMAIHTGMGMDTHICTCENTLFCEILYHFDTTHTSDKVTGSRECLYLHNISILEPLVTYQLCMYVRMYVRTYVCMYVGCNGIIIGLNDQFIVWSHALLKVITRFERDEMSN